LAGTAGTAAVSGNFFFCDLAISLEIIPETILLHKLTQFAEFAELAVLKIATGEVNRTAIVAWLTLTAIINLQPKPYYRVVIEIKVFGTCCSMPARLDVPGMVQNKSRIP
jgi:hypothetical protein